MVEDMGGKGDVFLGHVGLQFLLEACFIDHDGPCHKETINACASVCVGGEGTWLHRSVCRMRGRCQGGRRGQGRREGEWIMAMMRALQGGMPKPTGRACAIRGHAHSGGVLKPNWRICNTIHRVLLWTQPEHLLGGGPCHLPPPKEPLLGGIPVSPHPPPQTLPLRMRSRQQPRTLVTPMS